MKIWVRQLINEAPKPIDANELCASGGLWEPMIVQTQKEKDYLMAMQLMVGKTYEVCLDGVDKPIRDTPPTWVSIPHLD